MNVLYLTSKSPSLTAAPDADAILSFGYRHIIGKDVLAVFPGRAWNLHISILPWNRGASPNLWAWHDDTPHGVTLHEIDAGVDTGPIIVQRCVEFGERETLSTSYRTLAESARGLMMDWLPRLCGGNYEARPQTATGTYHTLYESDQLYQTLPLGWDTPVEWLRRRAA